MALSQVNRTIHYYDLDFTYSDNLEEDEVKFKSFFTSIINLSTQKDSVRYQYFSEKYIYVQDIKFDLQYKMVSGKVRCIRKDVFPEIMNTQTDDVRGIESLESEGIVETTHFIIDYSKPTKTLAIEYNQFGSKTQDLLNYLSSIGQSTEMIVEVKWRSVVKDDLKTYKDRMGRFSELIVKVHKNNLNELKTLNDSLFSAMDTAIDFFKPEYATLKLKFDYLKHQDTSDAQNIVSDLIRKLISKKENTQLFNILTVRAEDIERNNILSTFDLLIDRVKTEIKVQKKEKYKTIVSEDIFQKMKSELYKVIHS
jgi:DNA-binding Lrp family transcriptional regulator